MTGVTHPMRLARPARALLVAATLSGCSGSRDVVPPSNDVITNAPSPKSGAPGDYEYVARRPGAVVGLAEARGIPMPVAQAAVDHIADALASCAAERARAGDKAGGAARLVAHIDGNGVVGDASLRVDPGSGSAASAVLCFVAPAKNLVFPPVDAGQRGFAIEALWGPRSNGP